jgi:hypothetical protein
MKAVEFLNAGKKLVAGQRWLFNSGSLIYLAEILAETSNFKILAVNKSDPSYPQMVVGAILPHKSLLTGGDSWSYLEGQEAPK